jgi:UDP-glucose:(heptosyl)LPS alpha-1,3-glucosyltransferase
VSSPDVAVVFPAVHHRGGIERICWDLLEYLAPNHVTAFVGSSAPEGVPDGVAWARVTGRTDPRAVGMHARRSRTAAVVRSLRPGVTVTLGTVVPPGDVLWVQSVHRAWLHEARTVRTGPLTLPASVRFAMPRHRVLLAMEEEYFTGGSPRRILCTSPKVVDDLARYYQVDRSLTTVVPNAFDPERFNHERRARDRDRARAELGIGENELALLFLANELHRKGFAELLSAMAAADDPRMTLHVVGRAPITPFASMIRRLGLGARVRAHGSTADVGWYLAAADLMVLPTQYEPFGLVIIEALASGVPVLTTRLAGASPAVIEGRTGLLLDDPYDVEELTALLRRAADADLQRWGAEAAASVDEYRRDVVMAEVERLIFS